MDLAVAREVIKFLEVVVQELFSLEGDQYVTLSAVYPKVCFLLDKCLCPTSGDSPTAAKAKGELADYVRQRSVFS